MKALERRLGLGSVVAISISSMLGSGIFVLPGLAFLETGPSLWMAYLFSALCVLPAALSKSELATAMPTSGGTYVYLERTFGPLAGTIAGLGLWLSLLLKSAFALVGFGAYLSVFSELPLVYTSLSLLCLIVLLNIFGIGKVSGFLIVVVLLSVFGLFGLGTISTSTILRENFQPFLLEGVPGLVSATAMVFVSFAGVTKVAAIAEEIQKPEKNLPKGILMSLFLVTIIYCTTTFILAGNLTASELGGNLKPIYSLALKTGGEFIAIAAGVLGVLTMTSMANAGILAASRFPFAMGRDLLLPSAIGKLHPKFLTPVLSIILSGAIVAASILVLDVGKIAKLASAFMLLIYMFENVAVVVLRETRVQWYKPSYKAGLYPWMQIFGIISSLYLLFIMGFTSVTAIVGISIPGVIIFFLYSRKRMDRRGVVGIKGAKISTTKEDISDDKAKLLQYVDLPEKAGVLVGLFGKEHSQDTLIGMGQAIAKDQTVEVVHLLEVPEQTVLSDLQDDSAQVKSIRRRIRAMVAEKGTKISFDPIVDHDILRTTFDIAEYLKIKWLVVEWVGRTRGAFTIHNPIGWLRDHLDCNIIAFRDNGIRYFKKIMVLLDKTRNDAVVVEACRELAGAYGAEVCFMRFIDEDYEDCNPDLEEAYFGKLLENFNRPYSTEILVCDHKKSSIVEMTAEYDLLVFAKPQFMSLKERIFGSIEDQLIGQAACSVVNIQKGGKVKVRSILH